ncbi:type III secretion system stalk subunit SctO [Sinorhizobium meliloti]|uniref:type III secretion system stalk subunit SctO n=1 Tax=Rhizobium meliloti TaxID=382 RepID=UPI003D661A20
MTRKVDLRRLVELRALRMRRAEAAAELQYGRHRQATRAVEAAKHESLVHEAERRQQEEALYSQLAHDLLDQRDLENYRGALSALDDCARQLDGEIHAARESELREARRKQELAAEYRRKQKLHERISLVAEEKRRLDAKRADVFSEFDEEDALRPNSRKRSR